MTLDELQVLRAAKWAAWQAELPTPDRLAHFVRESGFTSFAVAPASPAWPFALPAIAAWGVDEDVLHALLEAELAALRVVEIELWPGRRLYVSAEVMGYLYICVGDKRPLEAYRRQANQRKLSFLAAEVYEQLLAAPAGLAPSQLRDIMGAERTSTLGIERALAELALTAKVLRAGRSAGEGHWRALVHALPATRGLPEVVSKVQAAAALVSQWLDTMDCDTEESIAEFFAPVFPRNRTRSAMLGLEAGREVAHDAVDGRPAYRLARREPLAPPTAAPPGAAAAQ